MYAYTSTLDEECISVVLSGVGVLSGGWFLHSIGIGLIHATLCFVREIQTIIQTKTFPRFVFGLCITYKTKGWLVLYTYKTDYFSETFSTPVIILSCV